MFCGKCGRELPDDVDNCPDCSTANISAPEPVVEPPPALGASARRSDPAPRQVFPEHLKIGWIVNSSLFAALIVDIFLLRHDRGINILLACGAIILIWLYPLVKAGKTIPWITWLLAALSVSLAMQSCGPADRMFIPLWIAVAILFAVKARNSLMELEGATLCGFFHRNTISELRIAHSIARSRSQGGRRVSEIVIGLLITIPILMIVVLLLVEADTAFGKSVEEILKTLNRLPSHLFWTGSLFACLCYVTGCLALAARAENEPRDSGSEMLPLLSSTVIVVSLVIVLAFFLYVHVGAVIESAGGFSNFSGDRFRTYIRRGFGELLAVEIIVGSVLIGLIHTRGWIDKAQLFHRAAAWLLILLVAGLNVSCGFRLWFYVSEYAVTLVRSVNAAGIVVSFCCLGLLCVRVARPLAIGRTLGQIALIFVVVYTAWSFTMPVRRIAEYNTKAYLNGVSTVEIDYLWYLGPDTYPALSTFYAERKRTQDQACTGRELDEYAIREETRLEKMSWIEWHPGRGKELKSLKEITPLIMYCEKPGRFMPTHRYRYMDD